MRFQKLYWFKRPDKDGFMTDGDDMKNIIAFTERDAWQPYAQYEPRWKLMGVSDGTLYRELTKETRAKLASLMARRTQIINAGKNLPAQLERQIEAANNAFNKANIDAMEQEYKKAKGNLERPPRNTKVYMGDPELIAEMQSGGIRSKISTE